MNIGGRAPGPDGGDEDSVLAAEYVLYLLSRDERASAEARLDVDGAFRRQVVRWAEHFASLAEEVSPVPPPPRLRAVLDRIVSAEAARPGVRRSRGGAIAGAFGWLLGGLAAAVASLVILSVALPRIEPPYSGPFYEATLEEEGSDLVAQARFDPRDGTLVVERRAGTAPQGRVLELWLLPEGAEAPTSLGVLPDDPVSRVTLPSEVAEGIPGGLLEISEEPPGGSPTGGPTGNVLAVGQVGTV